MAEKGMFVKFMSAARKHFKLHYPFIMQMEKSFDASMPKSSSFYLGVCPRYNKHVIISFMHGNKPWNVGEFTIYAHISAEYKVAGFDVLSKEFESFGDGLFNIPIVLTGINKYWCLKPTSSADDKYTIYWRPASYSSEETVIKETIADVCILLEKLFVKAGFMDPKPMEALPSAPHSLTETVTESVVKTENISLIKTAKVIPDKLQLSQTEWFEYLAMVVADAANNRFVYPDPLITLLKERAASTSADWLETSFNGWEYTLATRKRISQASKQIGTIKTEDLERLLCNLCALLVKFNMVLNSSIKYWLPVQAKQQSSANRQAFYDYLRFAAKACIDLIEAILKFPLKFTDDNIKSLIDSLRRASLGWATAGASENGHTVFPYLSVAETINKHTFSPTYSISSKMDELRDAIRMIPVIDIQQRRFKNQLETFTANRISD